MGVRFDEARIEIDWDADFVGWRTMKFAVKFTDQNDPLLLALRQRYEEQRTAAVKASTGEGDPFGGTM
jgi:hypothetical protein